MSQPPEPPQQAPRAPLPEVGQPFILPQGQPPPQFPDEGPAVPISKELARDRASYIRHLVQQVEALQKEGKTPAEIEVAVPEFLRDYPKLYEMVMKPGGYHKKSLTTMLAMLDRMGSGQLNQHEASVIVGQRVFDAFVKPMDEGQR
jgi:hypothetical protein